MNVELAHSERPVARERKPMLFYPGIVGLESRLIIREPTLASGFDDRRRQAGFARLRETDAQFPRLGN